MLNVTGRSGDAAVGESWNSGIPTPWLQQSGIVRRSRPMTAMRRTSSDSLGLLPYGNRQAAAGMHSRPGSSNGDSELPRQGRKWCAGVLPFLPLPEKGSGRGASSHSQGSQSTSGGPRLDCVRIPCRLFSTLQCDSTPSAIISKRTLEKLPSFCSLSKAVCSLFLGQISSLTSCPAN